MGVNLKSWVESANHSEADFTLANLPFGVFDAGDGSRIGVPIGDNVLDLVAAMDHGLLPDLRDANPSPGDIRRSAHRHKARGPGV